MNNKSGRSGQGRSRPISRFTGAGLGIVAALSGGFVQFASSAHAGPSQCWAVPDTGMELRGFIPDVAAPKEATIVKFLPPNDVKPHKGEGLAYRAKRTR
jgi:hypothetical protein